ncbi:ABC transporter substrate-binding protein [Nocardioides zeae]|uniref:ABC transporter substrate-binding protein n=1 Tax=Nocardioides imazamoxiresistens TaxID=3231893 RepID=A0ABU3PVT8_9ACTN|nr:ABC transporter substrate-binding protein [Nocardioides zeae]MDT9593351.1 ABC transporter substrate-binding protein [Nocardioides zeae]
MHKLPLRRSSALAAAASVALLGLTACSTGSSGSDGGNAPQANTTADADAFPVTIESAYGEATIEEEPERVVTLGVDGDVVASLGVAPVAVQKMTWGGNEAGTTDWFDETLAEIDGAEAPELIDVTDAVPTDQIIGLEPDVVIATNSGLTQDDFDKLTEAGIPVVAHPGVQWATTWEQSTEMTGQALGRSDAAADLVEEVQADLEATAEEHPEIVGASFVWAFFDPTDVSNIGVYTTADNRPAILEELGMVSPEIVTAGGTDSFFFNVSAERAAELDADVIMAYGTTVEESEALLETPVLQQIPPVAEGNYVITLEPNDTLGLSFPSVLGIPYALDHFIPEVAAAIGGEPQIY